jgi:hypothetical protein
MAKATSKLQVIALRAIADSLKLFEAATIRQKLRLRGRRPGRPANRGRCREDAYTRPAR